MSAGAKLDFLSLFSSTSGLTGQAGQANYTGGNAFQDTFVQYRDSLGLAASAVEIRAVQDVVYVSQDAGPLKRMMLPSAHGITEPEVLGEPDTAALPAREAGRKLKNFLLERDEYLKTSVPLCQLGVGSSERRDAQLVAPGSQLGSGNLGALGRQAAE